MNRSILLALLLATAACSPAGPGNDSADSAQTPARRSASSPPSIDKAVAPGDDFVAYANGDWVRNTPIPADRSSIGAFFIADQERRARRPASCSTGILGSKPAAGSNEALIADYYAAYLDTRRDRPRAAWRRAKADLDAIAARSPTRAQLSAALGGTMRADVDPLNATNYETENLFGDLRHPGPRHARARPCPICCRAGSACPTAIIISPATPEMARAPRPAIAPISATMLKR